MLNIKDLEVTVGSGAGEKKIIKGLNLQINEGEVHAIMGPNGSGKSTLSKVIAGHPDCHVNSGTVEYDVDFKKVNLLEMTPDERSKAGIFLAFQYPVEIAGLNNLVFLKAAFDAVCQAQGVALMSDSEFRLFVEKKSQALGLQPQFLDRGVNSGFSGGEKKRNEILQMMVLNPRIAFLDETDSGLDIDALKTVADGINRFKSEDKAVVLVTHYQRLLDYVIPDFIHVMVNGKIVKTGKKELALELEKKGYDQLVAEYQS